MEDGTRCPEFEHAPHTTEGQCAASAASSAGVWRWGALGGLAGIDWQAAALVHGDSETWPGVREALRHYEAGALEGAAEKARQRDPGAETGGARPRQ